MGPTNSGSEAWVKALIAFGGVAGLDYWINIHTHHMRLHVLYLVPILYLSWQMGLRASMALVALAIFVESFVNVSSHPHEIPALVISGEAALMFLMFVPVTYLVYRLHDSLVLAKTLSRIDHMTGASNYQHLLELLDAEIARMKRFKRPMSVVFFDLDNFKRINDTLGHTAGNELLKAVVQYANDTFRATDTVARVGGDEFVVLLPETDATDAKIAVQRFIERFSKRTEFPVDYLTISIGVKTFTQAPESVEDVLTQADSAMYSVKNSTKNGVVFT